MRSNPVSVFVANMRPNTKMFAFFDNENVTDFFRPDDVFTVTSGQESNFDFNNTELPVESSTRPQDS